jgi:pimeloyl-ACP methyl ester carboxylesterase
LCEQYRVVTFDGLSNGSSDRPTDSALYGDALFADDAAAVLDACGIEQAAVFGSSQGGAWALALAGRHPERVNAAVFIAPNVPLAREHPDREAASGTFFEELLEHPGWSRWNRRYWLDRFDDFLGFFFSQCFTEPDSESHILHFLSMGRQSTPEVLLATAVENDADLTDSMTRAFATAMQCPSLVIHDDQDAITPVTRGQELARLSGAELVVMSASGHEPHCRNPETTNPIIGAFLADAIANS